MIKDVKTCLFRCSYDGASDPHGCRRPHAGGAAGRYQPAGRSHGKDEFRTTLSAHGA